MYQLFEDNVWDLLLEEMEDSEDNFSGSFRLTTRLPRSREFSVSSGSVRVESSARWNYPSASVCPINRYQIRLWKKNSWYQRDDAFTAVWYPVGTRANYTWSGLPSGTYYLEIDAYNGNPICVLTGTITVTT